MVGGLLSLTGSYFAGLGVLGLVAPILGGIAVIVYRLRAARADRDGDGCKAA